MPTHNLTRLVAVAASLALSQAWSSPAAQQAPAASEKESDLLQTAVDAYVYLYPLVTMDQTRRIMTNAPKPEGTHAPMGQVVSQRAHPTAQFRDVTAPNADTLYSTAWIDVSKEPCVLHVPEMGDRYYLMPLLDAWTNVIEAPGTRTGVRTAADFAITGPGWKGDLPPGVKQIESPTNLVWLIGRVYSTGTEEDYRAVHALQDRISLRPLRAFGKSYMPPPGQVDPGVDMQTPTRDQVDAMDLPAFFQKAAELMKANPPSPDDAAMTARLAKIGIVPGRDFDFTGLPFDVQAILRRAPREAQLQIRAQARRAGTNQNGWTVTTRTGRYGTDYLQRAFITAVGLGANLPEDAVYPSVEVDSAGQTLTGAKTYVIHFPRGQTPPVDGFWSVTMYDTKMFFVENPLNRYSVSPRNQLVQNPDGSTDLYIQHGSPGKDKEANWLPAPEGEFTLMMRMYWPRDAVLSGDWKPPAVEPRGG